MLKSTYTTETMDRLFLELSQFTQATTAKELLLQAEISRSADELARLRTGIEAALVEIEGKESSESLQASRTAWVTSVYHGAVSDGLSQAARIVRKHTGVTK